MNLNLSVSLKNEEILNMFIVVYFFILQYHIFTEKVTNELTKLLKLNSVINSTSWGVIITKIGCPWAASSKFNEFGGDCSVISKDHPNNPLHSYWNYINFLTLPIVSHLLKVVIKYYLKLGVPKWFSKSFNIWSPSFHSFI